MFKGTWQRETFPQFCFKWVPYRNPIPNVNAFQIWFRILTDLQIRNEKNQTPHFLKQQLPTVNDMGSQRDGTPAKLNFA
jgi:hypothetical protein